MHCASEGFMFYKCLQENCEVAKELNMYYKLLLKCRNNFQNVQLLPTTVGTENFIQKNDSLPKVKQEEKSWKCSR